MMPFKHCDSQKDSSLDNLMSQQAPSINHYYIAIDLRTIRLNSNDTTANCQILFQPFYLQFSYAFFGITEYIKTYPSIRFGADNPGDAITIPHGFCGFNFATSQEKLCYTFANIPFIVQLILEKDDTLLGTAELDLNCLLRTKSHLVAENSDLGDNFVNTFVQVQDELNDQICEIQVVMFLQEIQNLAYCPDLKEVDPNSMIQVGGEFRKNELMGSLNDMIIETAHDIELWKEEQMKIFKSRLKQKEIEFLNNLSNDPETCAKNEQLSLMENNIKSTLDKLAEKEKIIDLRQKELDDKFYQLGQEIDDAIHDVRIQYEDKSLLLRNQIKNLENDKQKYQERMYQLERKLKEKDLKIRDLDLQLLDLTQATQRRAQSQQRATSLTRNAGNNARKIVITRDTK